MSGQRGQRMALRKRLTKAIESGGRLTIHPDEVRLVYKALYGATLPTLPQPGPGSGDGGKG